MDRRDFVKSIEVNNFEDYIVHHFDRTMALYDLVGSYDNIKISSNYDDPEFIKFDLLLSSNEEANRIKNVIDYTTLTIYDKTYIVISNVDDNQISVELQ